jgi:hypothetical protein
VQLFTTTEIALAVDVQVCTKSVNWLLPVCTVEL